RGEDAVQPAGDGGQRLGDELLGEDVGERQVAVLEELSSQEVHLSAKGSSVRIAHRGPPWRGWDGCQPPSSQERPASPRSLPPFGLRRSKCHSWGGPPRATDLDLAASGDPTGARNASDLKKRCVPVPLSRPTAGRTRGTCRSGAPMCPHRRTATR